MGKRGRPFKYHSDEERRAALVERRKSWKKSSPEERRMEYERKKQKMRDDPKYRAQVNAKRAERRKHKMQDPEYRAKRRTVEQRRKKRKIANMTDDERLTFYRARHLWRRFKIRPEEYDNLLAAQGGTCAICRGTCPTQENMPVDHDHDTGEIRGILCVTCNAGVGMFRDDPALLSDAIVYLADPPGVRILPLEARQEVLSL